jgi:mono/diheme cytochrome c family protein
MLLRTALAAAALGTAAMAAPKSKVTFHKDVLPVLQKHCQECHRPGEIAPMPLLNYQQARPWAKAMKEQALKGKMPPWPAEAGFAKFSNDRSLTKAEIDVLAAWADQGAPEGNPKDAPPPVKFTEGWNIPKPDLIIEMPTAVDIPEKGEIEYTYMVVPTNFTEDKWVSMVEVRPGNRRVVHHAVIYVREPGGTWLAEAKPGVPYIPPVKSPGQRFLNTAGAGNDVLTIYTPGMVPSVWGPGRAKQIKAGSDLIFQMHYTANGKAGKDQTRIGLVFSKEPPKERVITFAALNNMFKIPAGDPNYTAKAAVPINNEGILLSFFPHLHLRGKGFEYDVVHPDGKRETMLKLKYWDLNWQLDYRLAEPMRLKPGSKIEVRATWDNSKNNPNNPDPTRDVTWGEQSWEEMLVGFFDMAVDPKFNHRNFFIRQSTTVQSDPAPGAGH